MSTSVTHPCSVEPWSEAAPREWDRPPGTEDDNRLHWVVVRVGRAADQSMLGQLVNIDDLTSGSQVLPWTGDEWLADTVRNQVAGLPFQLEHDHATAGGGINRPIYDPRDGSLLLGGYLHTEAQNGRNMWEAVKRGDVREGSLSYDMDRDDTGRLLGCRIRELSLTTKGRIAGTTIRVCNSADHETPIEVITKATPPHQSSRVSSPATTCTFPTTTTTTTCTFSSAAATTMSASDSAAAAAATPMQEDVPSPPSSSSSSSSSAAAAAPSTIDLTDMDKAVEQWISLTPAQQALTDPATRNAMLFEMSKYAVAGREAQRQRAAAEQAERERMEREGTENYNKLRPIIAASGKERGIDLEDEEHANGVQALFKQPENRFYGQLFGGLAQDLSTTRSELEQLKEEKAALMAALQASGRSASSMGGASSRSSLSAAAAPKRATETPEAGAKRTATGEASRPVAAETPAPGGAPLMQQGAMGASAKEQMMQELMQANLPFIRMSRDGKTIENNGVGVLDQRDPFPINPEGSVRLYPGKLQQISVRNSAASGANVVPASVVEYHARQEPEISFNGTYNCGRVGKGYLVPAGHLANVSSIQAMMPK